MSNHVRITFIHELDISHASKSHKGLPVVNVHHGLYVMCEGLPVMQEESVCHAPQLQS